MHKTLYTERLRVRPVTQADAGFMLELVNSEGWLNYIGDRNLHTLAQAETYIMKISGTPDFYYNIIELKDGLQPVGLISFIRREENEHPDLGYALLPGFTGSGYAEEACRGYLTEWFKENPGQKVLAVTKNDNQRSIRLLERLGFVFESDQVKNGSAVKIFATNQPG